MISGIVRNVVMTICQERKNNMRKVIFYILGVITMVIAASCTSSKPSYVLSDSEMEEVLYDIHRAHFTYERGSDSRNDGEQQYALFLNVLKKHSISTSEWDSTMVYYTRHSDELEDIYKSLNDRLEYEASAIGASKGESTDTTDIWSEDKNILLTAAQPFTTQQWSIKADTLLKAGERLTLKFTALYLHESEKKNATCVLAIRLKNDSVVVSHQAVNRTGIYSVNISDNESIGIKEIKGMFMMQKRVGYERNSRNDDERQVLCIREICLVHELMAGAKRPQENSIQKADNDTIASENTETNVSSEDVSAERHQATSTSSEGEITESKRIKAFSHDAGSKPLPINRNTKMFDRPRLKNE